MNRSFSVAALCCAAALAGCGQDAVQMLPLAPLPTARIKFFNFGVNAPAVNFYANETKMTAVLSSTGTESTNGVAYGAVGNGGLYSGLAPGQYTLTGRISAATNKDLPIDTIAATIADGKFYSFYLSGFYNPTSKIVDGFIVEDPIPAPADYNLAYIRLVHAISNGGALTLYARLNGDTDPTHWVAVGTAVAYKGAGTFATLPPGVYDVGARYSGAAANNITRTAVGLVGGHVYTISARGDSTVTSTTATNRPFLDNTANR